MLNINIQSEMPAMVSGLVACNCGESISGFSGCREMRGQVDYTTTATIETSSGLIGLVTLIMALCWVGYYNDDLGKLGVTRWCEDIQVIDHLSLPTCHTH